MELNPLMPKIEHSGDSYEQREIARQKDLLSDLESSHNLARTLDRRDRPSLSKDAIGQHEAAFFAGHDDYRSRVSASGKYEKAVGEYDRQIEAAAQKGDDRASQSAKLARDAYRRKYLQALKEGGASLRRF